MIRTADAYRAGLSDGRRVFYRGEAVKDVVADPELRVAVDHSAMAFDLAHDPDVRELAVDMIDGDECSAFYSVPRSTADLARRSRLIETAAQRGSGMIVLKEVGTDASSACSDRSTAPVSNGRRSSTGAASTRTSP